MGKGEGNGEGWGNGEGCARGHWQDGLFKSCKFGPLCKYNITRFRKIKQKT